MRRPILYVVPPPMPGRPWWQIALDAVGVLAIVGLFVFLGMGSTTLAFLGIR